MQWASKVGNREKGEEGSAWPLCSGRPLGTADAVPCRGQRGIYTWIARHLPCEARPRAPATHYPLFPTLYSLLYAVGVRRARQMPCLAEDREGFTQGSRGICRARRAHARQPRTSPSILLPIPYSTDAHCIVSTHFSLHSPPYSLLDGRPLHSVHALFPPFSSLFSTFFVF